jgi:copper transport protein
VSLHQFKRIIAGVIAALFLVLPLTPTSASAHSILDSSFPSASSVLAESPREVKLDFNEQIESHLGNISLFDQKQQAIKIGNLVRSASDQSVVTAKLPSLKNGVYVVVWRVLSADGHPVSGAFPFEIGTTSSGTADALLQKIVNGITATSDLGNPLAAMRFVAFLAVIILFGLLSVTRRSQLIITPVVQRSARLSAVALIISSFGLLLLQGPYVSGRSWGAICDVSLASDVITTRLGMWLLTRILCGALWGVMLVLAGSHHKNWWRRSAVVLALVTLLTFSASGHPSAASLPGIFISVDVVHLIAISLWVGALVAITILSRSIDTTEMVRSFSRSATWAMPLTVVTGVVQGLHLNGGISGIFDSDYGKLLAVKTIAVAAIILFGASARKKLSSLESKSISSLIRKESAVVILVVALTALMVAKAPRVTSDPASTSFSTTLIQANVFTELLVDPAVVGPSQVHVILTPPGGTLTPVLDVQVRFELPSRNIPPIPVTMVAVGPNHWLGVIQLPYAGKWTMEARVEPKKNQTLLFTTEVLVTD